MLTRKQRWKRQVKSTRPLDDAASAAAEPGERSQTYCDCVLDAFQPIVGMFLQHLSPAVHDEGALADGSEASPRDGHLHEADRSPASGAVQVEMVVKDHLSLSVTDESVAGASIDPSKVLLPPPKGLPRLRSAMSMGDLQSAVRPEKRRHMRFSSTVYVCLVPTRDELSHIMDDLFFRPDDFAGFKHEAVLELREVLTRLGLTSKQAIQLMYQPQLDAAVKQGAGLLLHHPAAEYEVEGPSLSDDEAPAPSPRGEPAREVASIPMEVEGPSLSDDEDEAEAYRATVDNNLRAVAFITGIKTDVELNAQTAAGQSPDKFGKSALGGATARVLPSHTPSGAISEAHATWQVQWKGPAASNPAEIPKPSIRMRNKLVVKE